MFGGELEVCNVFTQFQCNLLMGWELGWCSSYGKQTQFVIYVHSPFFSVVEPLSYKPSGSSPPAKVLGSKLVMNTQLKP